jgi:hypothetical protein
MEIGISGGFRNAKSRIGHRIGFCDYFELLVDGNRSNQTAIRGVEGPKVE